jgi:hypothetical protein
VFALLYNSAFVLFVFEAIKLPPLAILEARLMLGPTGAASPSEKQTKTNQTKKTH